MKTLLLGNVRSKTSLMGAVLTIFGVLYDNWSQVATLIPPEHTGKVFSLLGVVVMVLRNLSKDSIAEKGGAISIDTPVQKEGGFARTSLLAIVAVIASCLFLSCATLQKNPAVFHLATDIAVLKFIDNSSPEKKQSRIDHIREIATAVKVATTGDASISMPVLKDKVGHELAKLHISVTDLLLAQELVNILAQELEVRVGQGLLNSDQKLQVAMVMDWVIQAVDSLPKT